MNVLQVLILVGIMLLGGVLRFWNLDAKPLWMDEVITALFSLGRSYFDVPLEQAFSLSTLNQVFALRPDASCIGIAETISVQSVHPPLFFCWLHGWLNLLQAIDLSWVWKLRSLPALAGVLTIAAIYALNRVAFSMRAGLIGAGLMAVSPFAVYLSQEARHYTVPMLLLSLSLLGLIRIQQDLRQQQLKPGVWLGWIIVNSVGFYVHYFFILATIAQLLTLIFLLKRLSNGKTKAALFRRLCWLMLAIVGLGLSYLPWLPTFISHLGRPETDWLRQSQLGWLQVIAPLYQLTAGWLVMVVALPVENQPLWAAIPAALLMLLFGGWLVRQVLRGMRQLWQDPDTHWETLTLTLFVLFVLLEFLAIVYILHKDITQVPRYNFIYYPAVCALLAAILWKGTGSKKADSQIQASTLRPLFIVVLVGLLSSGFVVYDRVFLKPYAPQQVAQDILGASGATLTVMGYEDFQDIALGLEFALALQRTEPSNLNFAFASRSRGYELLWRQLAALKTSNTPQNLWVIAPGLRRRDFPAQLSLSNAVCQADATRYRRIGVPYQGYRCLE